MATYTCSAYCSEMDERERRWQNVFQGQRSSGVSRWSFPPLFAPPQTAGFRRRLAPNHAPRLLQCTVCVSFSLSRGPAPAGEVRWLIRRPSLPRLKLHCNDAKGSYPGQTPWPPTPVRGKLMNPFNIYIYIWANSLSDNSILYKQLKVLGWSQDYN